MGNYNSQISSREKEPYLWRHLLEVAILQPQHDWGITPSQKLLQWEEEPVCSCFGVFCRLFLGYFAPLIGAEQGSSWLVSTIAQH